MMKRVAVALVALLLSAPMAHAQSGSFTNFLNNAPPRTASTADGVPCIANGVTNKCTAQSIANLANVSASISIGTTPITNCSTNGALLRNASNVAGCSLNTDGGGGTISGASTASPGLSVTGTLNTTGNVDGALLYGNLTDTAAGSGTSVVDLKVGGTSIFTLSPQAEVFAGSNLVFFGYGLGANYNGMFYGDGLSLGSSSGFGPTWNKSGGSLIQVGMFNDASVHVASSGYYGFTNAGYANGNGGTSSVDTRISRLSAGVVSVDTTTNGNHAGSIEAASFLFAPTTVSALPTCNTAAKGQRYVVTDGAAASFLGSVGAGGGSVVEPALCNGTTWVQG